jgi:hypothetical protein
MGALSMESNLIRRKNSDVKGGAPLVLAGYRGSHDVVPMLHRLYSQAPPYAAQAHDDDVHRVGVVSSPLK